MQRDSKGRFVRKAKPSSRASRSTVIVRREVAAPPSAPRRSAPRRRHGLGRVVGIDWKSLAIVGAAGYLVSRIIASDWGKEQRALDAQGKPKTMLGSVVAEHGWSPVVAGSALLAGHFLPRHRQLASNVAAAGVFAYGMRVAATKDGKVDAAGQVLGPSLMDLARADV